MPDRGSGTSAPSAPRVKPPQPARPGTGAGARHVPRFTKGAVRLPPEIARTPIERDRDIRRRRPPLLAFLMRRTTLRRAARIVSLPVLDFVGLALAIFTALVIKEAIQEGTVDFTRAVHGTEDFLPFAYLLTVLL